MSGVEDYRGRGVDGADDWPACIQAESVPAVEETEIFSRYAGNWALVALDKEEHPVDGLL